MGSIAGAGSGEFNTYRRQKRHEEERMARIERRANAIAEKEEFEARKRMREEADEERTAKRREKRQKKKKAKKHAMQQEAMRKKALEILAAQNASKEEDAKQPQAAGDTKETSLSPHSDEQPGKSSSD